MSTTYVLVAREDETQSRKDSAGLMLPARRETVQDWLDDCPEHWKITVVTIEEWRKEMSDG